jgi:hypothetical protein
MLIFRELKQRKRCECCLLSMMLQYTTFERLLIVGLTLVFSSAANGQQVFPTFADEPQWNVYGGYGSFESTGYTTSTWFYQSDTVFCDHTYSKVGSEGSNFFGGMLTFVRVDGEQVFIRTSSDCSDTSVRGIT